jgi:hypothetical protein
MATPFKTYRSDMDQRGSNEVIILHSGGYPGYGNFLNQTFKWNGTGWTLLNNISVNAIDPNGPLPLRTNQASCYDGYNILLFGGQGASSTAGYLQDTWLWNGTTWTIQNTPVAPFGRAKHDLAYLSSASAGKAIMFGGTNGLNFLQETWVWNGSSKVWSQAFPANSPQARIDHSMADGPSFVVVFGGKNTNSCLNDVWTYNGSNWNNTIPNGSGSGPGVRAEMSMCYDIANTQWVMFGGRNDNNMIPPETWILNSTATAWTKMAPAISPSARVNAQMCYDGQSGKVILVGGNDQAGNALSDMWSWSGSAWVQLS